MSGGRTRRLWEVMDRAVSSLVYWLVALLVASGFEWLTGAFEKDPYQTYSFVVL